MFRQCYWSDIYILPVDLARAKNLIAVFGVPFCVDWPEAVDAVNAGFHTELIGAAGWIASSPEHEIQWDSCRTDDGKRERDGLGE